MPLRDFVPKDYYAKSGGNWTTNKGETEGGHNSCIGLRSLTHVGLFSKTESDSFRSVLVYKKEQES